MSQSLHLILAIESSCDDTSAAVLQKSTVLSNIVAGQAVHEFYGGVVPELASRAHQQNIIPVVHKALQDASVAKNQLSAIAVTMGPGLAGSLHVGVAFAKSLSIGLNIPLIEVNHMQAHILAHFIDDAGVEKPEFPFLCLTVSGGHTQIVRVESPTKMNVIGKTIDDAAGEAFDKAAKVLGLPYPGGPLVDKQAQLGDSGRFAFPHPSVQGLDYSFSGLKTSLLYFLRDQQALDSDFIQKNLNDICAGYQNAVVSFLLSKLKRAANETGINQIAIAGGVSANSLLRKELNNLSTQLNWKVFIPKFEYCTDNAAMIGIAGYFKFVNNGFAKLSAAPQSRMLF
jgi:N6-L-threonylcarbamoyladenine synthase